jgi:hypothetical protein
VKRGTAVVVLTAALALAGPAYALTGAEWRRLAEPAKRAYVDGVIDGWQSVATVQESLGTRDRGVTVFADIVTCLRERLVPPPQIFALVERHVEDYPGLLGKDMSDIVFAALSLTCRR